MWKSKSWVAEAAGTAVIELWVDVLLCDQNSCWYTRNNHNQMGKISVFPPMDLEKCQIQNGMDLQALILKIGLISSMFFTLELSKNWKSEFGQELEVFIRKCPKIVVPWFEGVVSLIFVVYIGNGFMSKFVVRIS